MMRALQSVTIWSGSSNTNALSKSLQETEVNLNAWPLNASADIVAADESSTASEEQPEHMVDLKSERDRKKFTRRAALKSLCFSSTQDKNSGKEKL